MVEITDIQGDSVNCLDVVAIGDFDIKEASLQNGGIKGFPTNNNDENYEECKRNLENDVKINFNNKMGDVLPIEEDAQLTPLGNNTNQYILTDKGTMRHYRIDHNGKISLDTIIIRKKKDVKVRLDTVPEGKYRYGYCLVDLYGRKYYTRFTDYKVE